MTAEAIPAGGITCTCGHTIPEDGVCCCPKYCETCGPQDCCAEAWAIAQAKAAES
jgi:hypothetical protein